MKRPARVRTIEAARAYTLALEALVIAEQRAGSRVERRAERAKRALRRLLALAGISEPSDEELFFAFGSPE